MPTDIPGLTAKVLNERLRNLLHFGILERRAYPEIPLRVECHPTRLGRRFTRLPDASERLPSDLDDGRA